MGSENGEMNSLATRVAVSKDLMDNEMGEDTFVDHLLNKKVNADKQEVVEHMNDFSCKEELERYVEHLENQDN